MDESERGIRDLPITSCPAQLNVAWPAGKRSSADVRRSIPRSGSRSIMAATDVGSASNIHRAMKIG